MYFGLSPFASIGFRAGLIGGVVLTIGMVIMRAVEATPINFELALGSLMTRSFDPMTWILGFAAHLFISGAIGIFYAKAFEAVNRFGAGVGIVFGLLHWMVSGLVMGMVPEMFSMVPELFGVPGYFGIQFGGFTAAGIGLLHLLFGAVEGTLYESARKRLTALPAAVVSEPLRRVA